jgi:3-isopropylmalate dehydrogenase
MSIDILALDGDGIGPEIMQSTLDIVDFLNKELKLDIQIRKKVIGLKSLDQNSTTMTSEVILASKEADGIILGPVDHNNYPSVADGGVNPSGKLRIELDLYANIRPARNYINLNSLSKDMDLIIVRENTEGFYSDRNMFDGPGEFSPIPGVGLAIRKITKNASLRIAETAFKIAKTKFASKNKKA